MSTPRLFRSIRTNIITGILLLLPLITTIYVFINLFKLVDNVLPSLFHALVPRLPEQWGSGIGFVVILFLAYFAGLAAKNYFGNLIIQTGNAIISNIPILNKIYVGVQQILDAVVGNKKKLFDRAVLIEYPKADCYSIAFVTSETTGEIPQKIGERMVSLFIPTTPNPTSGFLLFLPESKIIDLDMNVETAIKLIMSAGMVNVDQLKKTQHLYTIPKSLKKWNWFLNLKRSGKDAFHDPRD